MKEIHWVFKLERAGEVSIILKGEITQEGIDKLIQMLELSKDTFPPRDEAREER